MLGRRAAEQQHSHELHAHQAVAVRDAADVCEWCGQVHVYVCPRIAHARYEMVLDAEGNYKRQVVEVWFYESTSHELWHTVLEAKEPEV